ncbi:uncharacterized protein KY384_004286 [Bacidia gigantensis]|uniref:uncharacterized protein n=1 Tax=Bacidia gigantensis TaxID=2732470 RepID=UPI001D044A23|nr:uncharacterized protein KY384_004286 [Bacidia gigantensis]KAG8530929.1 hypothetical protein KY384_004286 [Bacidia gigantensis]
MVIGYRTAQYFCLKYSCRRLWGNDASTGRCFSNTRSLRDKTPNQHEAWGSSKAAVERDGEREGSRMSDRLSQLTDESIEQGGKAALQAVKEAGFSEELRERLEAKIQSTSFKNDHAAAFAQVDLPDNAGKGTRLHASAEPWTGQESLPSAALRMLEDTHKPLRGYKVTRAASRPTLGIVDSRMKKTVQRSPGERLANARDRTSVYALSQDSNLNEKEREQMRKQLKERFTAGARPMPTTVQGLASLANERIEDAIARGQFKNIPRGKGKNIEKDHNANSPFLDTTEYFMNKMIQKQEIVPLWIEKQQELVKAASAFRRRLRADWKRHAARMIASKGGSLEAQVRRAKAYAEAEDVANPKTPKSEAISGFDAEGKLSQITMTETGAPANAAEYVKIIVSEELADKASMPTDSKGGSEATSTDVEQTPPGESSSGAVAVRLFRDPEWESLERSYHILLVTGLNNLTRSYNLQAPDLAKKPYFSLARELKACFAEVAPQLAEEIQQRARKPEKIRVEIIGHRAGGVLERFGGEKVAVYDSQKPNYGFKQFWKDLWHREAQHNDKIKEKRAQAQRPNKSRDSSNALSNGEHKTRDLQSSPFSSPGNREKAGLKSRRPSGTTGRPSVAPKELGLRDTQEHLSKVIKQNFDLQLEIFHRRQRNDELEAKLARFGALEVDHERLQSANDDLRLQVSKRDADLSLRETAIEEAVAMICDLEARVEDLEQELRYQTEDGRSSIGNKGQGHQQNGTQPTSSKATPRDSDTYRSPTIKIHDSSNESDTLLASSPRSPRRPPSFLRDDKRSSAALRSLYSSRNPSVASLARPSSIMSDEEWDEELERQMLHSPRLSILSESGFSSIYGHIREKENSSTQSADQPYDDSITKSEDASAERAAQRQARIDNWVEERQSHERPKTPTRHSSRHSNARLSSIGEILEKVPGMSAQRPNVLGLTRSQKSASSSSKQSLENGNLENRSPTKSLRKSAKAHANLSAQNVVFGGNHLPPTPDTMGTATHEANSSTQSVVTEKSVTDAALVFNYGYGPNIRNDPVKPSSSASNSHLGDYLQRTADALLDASSEDLGSTQAQQSEKGLSADVPIAPPIAPLRKKHSKAARFAGSSTPARPALSTHVTDMMFNGDGFKPKEPTRNMSYPSPTVFIGPIPTQHSPNSRRSSGVPSEKTVTSPRRQSPSHPRAQLSQQGNKEGLEDVRTVFSDNTPAALRSHGPEQAANSNQGSSQSVTSRFFRRHKSQASNAAYPAQEVALTRPPSSHRLSRPSSIHVTRPGTSDGTNATLTLQREKQKPKVRRHSALLDDDTVGLGNNTPRAIGYQDAQLKHGRLISTLGTDARLHRETEKRPHYRGRTASFESLEDRLVLRFEMGCISNGEGIDVDRV